MLKQKRRERERNLGVCIIKKRDWNPVRAVAILILRRRLRWMLANV
jgi:hypothetical protein